jgi:hypothetical protein
VENLRQFYKKALQYVFGATAFLGLLIGFNYHFPSDWLRYAITLGGLIFLAIEWAVRSHVWKVFHNDLNIAGKWDAKTTYEGVQIPAGKQGAPLFKLPRAAEHTATFHQDCLTLAIKLDGAAGVDFPVFYSLAIDLEQKSEPGHLKSTIVRYAYQVKYSTGAGSGCPGNEATGYEIMEVIDREKLSGMRALFAKVGICKARPTEMLGKFWHCATPDGAAYYGSAKFWRSF